MLVLENGWRLVQANSTIAVEVLGQIVRQCWTVDFQTNLEITVQAFLFDVRAIEDDVANFVPGNLGVHVAGVVTEDVRPGLYERF